MQSLSQASYTAEWGLEICLLPLSEPGKNSCNMVQKEFQTSDYQDIQKVKDV